MILVTQSDRGSVLGVTNSPSGWLRNTVDAAQSVEYNLAYQHVGW